METFLNNPFVYGTDSTALTSPLGKVYKHSRAATSPKPALPANPSAAPPNEFERTRSAAHFGAVLDFECFSGAAKPLNSRHLRVSARKDAIAWIEKRVVH